MQYTALIILLALCQYAFFLARTGFGRTKYNVPAPDMTGNDTWERILRVQQNTAEQLILFIPATVAFAHYVNHFWVLAPGLMFLLGRQYYSHMYIKNPNKRAAGMIISFLSSMSMVFASIISLLGTI